MESWRKAWKGTTPVEPLKDPEWVAWRREFLAERSDPSAVSDEVAAQEYRAIQAQWLIGHVRLFGGRRGGKRRKSCADKEVSSLTIGLSGPSFLPIIAPVRYP